MKMRRGRDRTVILHILGFSVVDGTGEYKRFSDLCQVRFGALTALILKIASCECGKFVWAK
jgi:hypothetical protein